MQDPFSLADPWGPNRTSVFPYTRNDQGEGLFPANPFSLEIRDLEWQPGDVHQFNLTFQHQLGDQIVVSAGYVGSRGRNLTQVRNLNLAALHSGCLDDAERGRASAEPELHEHHSVISRVVVGLRFVAGHGA